MQTPQITFSQSKKPCFTSKLTFISSSRDVFMPRQFCVNYPYTENEIIRAPFGLVEKIKTCPAGGIITPRVDSQGWDAVFFHLDPPQEEMKENSNIEVIENAIKRKLDKGIPVQGLLAGAKDCFSYSLDYFERLEEMFQQFKIPFTRLKGQKEYGVMSLVYDGTHNEWRINLESLFPVVKKGKEKEELKASENQKLIDKIIGSDPSTLLTNLKNYFFEVDVCEKDLKDSGIIA